MGTFVSFALVADRLQCPKCDQDFANTLDGLLAAKSHYGVDHG